VIDVVDVIEVSDDCDGMIGDCDLMLQLFFGRAEFVCVCVCVCVDMCVCVFVCVDV